MIVQNKSYFDIFFAHFVKNLTPGHPSSGHQARSSDSISKKKFAIVPQPQWWRGRFENNRIWYNIWYLHFVYLGILI